METSFPVTIAEPQRKAEPLRGAEERMGAQVVLETGIARSAGTTQLPHFIGKETEPREGTVACQWSDPERE